MRLTMFLLLLLAPLGSGAGNLPPIQTVFLVLMENHNWDSIKGSVDAPYINGTLLPRAAYCEQYYNPPGLHPSLPNYLWLEAGTNFGIFDDNDPSSDHQGTTNHLTTLLHAAGISWKAYEEDISGTYIPLTGTNRYAPRHDPFVYFDDITGTNALTYPYGLQHIRPYGELATDLTNNNVARYNFITPNLCSDMHDSCSPLSNPVKQGDDWLATEVPKILNSAAFQNGGALLITWDEGIDGDGPVGMMVISPLGRGGGYSNNIYYSHSSTVRTVQEIFGVGPLLGDAANATDLSDLFVQLGFGAIKRQTNGAVELSVTGASPGKTNLVKASSDLTNWVCISTNLPLSTSFQVTDPAATNFNVRFYRVVEFP